MTLLHLKSSERPLTEQMRHSYKYITTIFIKKNVQQKLLHVTWVTFPLASKEARMKRKSAGEQGNVTGIHDETGVQV